MFFKRCASAYVGAALSLAITSFGSAAFAADMKVLKAPPPPAPTLDIHGFFDVTFANDYITPRGLLVTNTGLTTQVLSEAEELCDDILIMNKGRQLARGDLHALKLLSRDVYEVAMTFEKMPRGIEQELALLDPVRMHVNSNTIELALRAEEQRVLDLVSELARKGRVLRVEVRGASLEDIFVQLLKQAEPSIADCGLRIAD